MLLGADGSPSIPPSVLAKVLLLAYRCGLSDRAGDGGGGVGCCGIESVALGLQVDANEGGHPTSLTKYRARLLLHGKERLALENTCASRRSWRCQDAPAEQIVDSTPMLGRGGDPGHGEACPLWGQEADRCGHGDRQGGWLGRWPTGSSSTTKSPGRSRTVGGGSRPSGERMLARVAQDAERALRAVEQADGLARVAGRPHASSCCVS